LIKGFDKKGCDKKGCDKKASFIALAGSVGDPDADIDSALAQLKRQETIVERD